MNLSQPSLVQRKNAQLNEQQRLQQQLTMMQQQLYQVTGFLLALLCEKHNGQTAVTMKGCNDKQHWGFLPRPMPALGTISLQVVEPGGGMYRGGLSEAEAPVIEHPAGEPDAEAPVSVDEAAPACPDAWHKDADATGLRCPACGSATRL